MLSAVFWKNYGVVRGIGDFCLNSSVVDWGAVFEGIVLMGEFEFLIGCIDGVRRIV